MLRNIIGPLFNFKNCVFFVVFLGLFFKHPLLSAGRTRFLKTKKHKENKKLDHFLTLKRAKIGPLFNFTAYIYIYIYFYIFCLAVCFEGLTIMNGSLFLGTLQLLILRTSWPGRRSEVLQRVLAGVELAKIGVLRWVLARSTIPPKIYAVNYTVRPNGITDREELFSK